MLGGGSDGAVGGVLRVRGDDRGAERDGEDEGAGASARVVHSSEYAALIADNTERGCGGVARKNPQGGRQPSIRVRAGFVVKSLWQKLMCPGLVRHFPKMVGVGHFGIRYGTNLH